MLPSQMYCVQQLIVGQVPASREYSGMQRGAALAFAYVGINGHLRLSAFENEVKELPGLLTVTACSGT